MFNVTGTIGSYQPPMRYSPQQAAERAYGFAASSCPEQLPTNELLRTYLQNWNINPDA